MTIPLFYINYLVVKRLPGGYESLEPWEKFKAIEHSGISMRVNKPLARFYENAKKFDDKKFGMILLFEWDSERAREAGFESQGLFKFFY
jgi:hypothetical protein